MVAVLKVGSEWDPRRVMDMTLTAYRDAIDYLGYFRDGYGSMVDGIGMEDFLSKRVLAERVGKVKGVRVNCLGCQASRLGRQSVQVEVPKTHPLFNLEGDDPLDITGYLERRWVVKSYACKHGARGEDSTDGKEQDLRQNPLAKLLLLQVSRDDEEWGEIAKSRLEHTSGCVLVVDQGNLDVTVESVQAVCKMIEQVVVPLIANNRSSSSIRRAGVVEAVNWENLQWFLQTQF